MPIEPINTTPIQQFINQVKGADASQQKEIKLDIVTARKLALTLGEVMSRTTGELEKFVKENAPKGEETVTIKMDAGGSWK
jgi:hypothetical protein